MEDWEDAGLALGVIGILVGCFLVGCWKMRQEHQYDFLTEPV